MIEVLLALVAALLFALGTVLQQKASLDAPSTAEGSSSGLLLRMVRQPIWLAGIAADALGFVAQAVALTIGRIAVVQPLLITSVVFALPLGARLTGQHVGRREIGGAVLVTSALAVFLLVADPSGGRNDAPLHEWVLAGAVFGGLSALLVLLARGAQPKAKAALLGTATGLLFGLSAALTKTVGDQVEHGLFTIFADWHLYALIVVGYASMTLNQLALATGALAPAVATAMAFDPISSVVLGTTLLQESLDTSAVGVALGLVALAATLTGLAVLARTQGELVAEPQSTG
jgi:drug/metabolite transporter (DMT)-like permease